MTAALARLKPVLNDRNISLSSKIRLMHSLVTFIFLYACESWTLTAELQRRIWAMEMRCYHKVLHISYKDHVTNKEDCWDSAGSWTTWRPLDHHNETQTEMVRTCLPFIRSGQTEKELGRQHQGIERPGVCQVPEGSGEQRKVEETGWFK